MANGILDSALKVLQRPTSPVVIPNASGLEVQAQTVGVRRVSMRTGYNPFGWTGTPAENGNLQFRYNNPTDSMRFVMLGGITSPLENPYACKRMAEILNPIVGSAMTYLDADIIESIWEFNSLCKVFGITGIQFKNLSYTGSDKDTILENKFMGILTPTGTNAKVTDYISVIDLNTPNLFQANKIMPDASGYTFNAGGDSFLGLNLAPGETLNLSLMWNNTEATV